MQLVLTDEEAGRVGQILDNYKFCPPIKELSYGNVMEAILSFVEAHDSEFEEFISEGKHEDQPPYEYRRELQ